MATRSRRFAATWLLVCAIACSDTGSPAGPQEEQPDTTLTPDEIPTPLAGGATTVFSVRADAGVEISAGHFRALAAQARTAVLRFLRSL